MRLSIVVFPLPDSPIKAVIPGRILKLKLENKGF